MAKSLFSKITNKIFYKEATKETYLEKFCAHSNTKPENLAPHVKDILEQMDAPEGKWNFDTIVEQCNSTDVMDAVSKDYIQPTIKCLEDNPEHSDKIETLNACSGPLEKQQIEEVVFDFMKGIQDSYQRDPYKPYGGITMPVKTSKGDYVKCHYRNMYDEIQITPGMVRYMAVCSETGSSMKSPFGTQKVSEKGAYAAGYEEQDHACDLRKHKINKKGDAVAKEMSEAAVVGSYHSPDKFTVKESIDGKGEKLLIVEKVQKSGKGVYHDSNLEEKGVYQTQNLAELTAGIRRLDRVVNEGRGESEKGNTPKSKAELLEEAGIADLSDRIAAMDAQANRLCDENTPAKTNFAMVKPKIHR